MVAADHDGRFDLAVGDEAVEDLAHLGALAVLEPADAAGQALEVDLLGGHADPAGDHLVVGEGLEHGAVGARDVGGVARQRRPAEGPVAAAEQRPDVERHEALEGEGVGVAGGLGLAADVVAVVEDVGARLLQGDHGLDVHDDRGDRAPRVLGGIGAAQLERLAQGHAVGHVAVQGVVSRGLVGDQVGHDAAPHELGVDVGGVAQQADRERLATVGGGRGPAQGLVERLGRAVDVAGLEAALDAHGVDLDAQRHAARHGHRQRLRAAHAAEAGGEHEPTRKVAPAP